MTVLAIGLGVVVVAFGVWLSVAADAITLARDAGWWALVVLAFPVLVGVGAWRDW